VKRFVLLQSLNRDTIGRTPWTGDQPVTRPLPTQTQYKHTDIHTLCRIRTHDPSVRASEDSTCLRPRGHCDLLYNAIEIYISTANLRSCKLYFSIQTQSQSHVTTDGQSASLSWNKAPIWDLRPDFYYCQIVAGLLM
jgi:hypothetical protein